MRPVLGSRGVGVHSLIADNAIHGAFLLGKPNPIATSADEQLLRDLASVAVEIHVNGKVVATGGSGRDVLGHPLVALAWLANERSRQRGAEQQGAPVLKTGDHISTGACGSTYAARPGDRVTGCFGPRLGKVHASIGVDAVAVQGDGRATPMIGKL